MTSSSSSVTQYVRGAVEALDGRRRQQDHRPLAHRLQRGPGAGRGRVRHRRDRRRPLAHAALERRRECAPAPTPRWSPIPMASRCRSFRPTSTASISASSQVTWDDNGKVTAAAGEPILLDESVDAGRGLPRPGRRARRPDPGSDGRRHRHRDRSHRGQPRSLPRHGMRDGQPRSPTPSSTASRIRARPSPSRTAAACAPRSMPAKSRWAKCSPCCPSRNTLATVQVSGADVIEALENGVSRRRERRRPLPAGCRSQVRLRYLKACR